MGDQRPAQVEPVRWFDHLGSPDGRRPDDDDDVDVDGVDLSVVVDIDAGEYVAPCGQSWLVLAETSRSGADEAEGEVITEVDVHQSDQRLLGFGEVGCLLGGKVHVLGGA